MRRGLRLTALWGLAVFAAPFTAADHHREAPSLELPSTEITGIYGGTFLCSLGEMGMTLSLEFGGFPELKDYPGMPCKSGSGPCNDRVNARLKKMRKVEGVISFFPTVGNPEAPAGAFRISGVAEYTSKVTTRLFLDPDDWIDKPDNFGSSGIEGTIVDGKIYGKPTAQGCHTLQMYKIRS